MNTSRPYFRVAFGFAFALLVGVNQLSAGGFFIPAPVTTYSPPVQVYVPPVVHTYVPPVQTYVPPPVVHTYVPPAPTYTAPVHVNVAPTHVNVAPTSTYTAPTHVNAAPRTTYTPSSSNDAAPVHHSHTVSRPAPVSPSSESAESESPRTASTHAGRTHVPASPHVTNSTPTTEASSPSASVSSAGKLPVSHLSPEVHTGGLTDGGHTWKRPTSSGSIPPATASGSVASGHLPPVATTAGTAGSGHGWKRPTTPVATVPLGGSATTGGVAARPSGFTVPHHGTGPVQNLGRDGAGAPANKLPLFAAHPGSTPISGDYRGPDGHRHTNSFGVVTSGGGHSLGSTADGSGFSASGYSAQDHLNDMLARNQALQDSWSQFSDQVQAAVQDSLNNPPDADADPNQYVDQPPQLDAAPDQDFAPPPQAMMAYNDVATQPGDAQPQGAPQAAQEMPAAPAQVAYAPARSRRSAAAPDVTSTALPDAAPVDTLAPPTDGFDGQPANGGTTATDTALSVPALPPAPTQTEAAADYTALVQTPGVDADGFAGNNGGSSRWDKVSQDYLANVSATAVDGSDASAGTPTVWGRMANASVVMTATEMVSAMQGSGGGNLQSQLKEQNSPEAAYAAKWVGNLMSGVAGGPAAAAKSIREGANMMMAKMNEAFDTLPTLMNPNQSSSAPDSYRR